ncbi:MAG: glycosyltransferase, partial [Geminicoccales bacterium]
MRKITILSMDLDNECTTRCVLMAKALRRKYDVEILGLLWQSRYRASRSVWPYFRDLDIPITAVEGRPWPGFAKTAARLLKRIDGDVVIACKSRPASYGIALLNRVLRRVPVILDVDDDEVAITELTYGRGRWLSIGHPNGYRATRLVYLLRRRADAVTCVSERFCREYGGIIAPHARDPAEYDPAVRDGVALRRSLGFSRNDHVIGFIGTPRRMKGIHVLLDALDKLHRPNVKLLIVGAAEGVSDV